MSRKRKRRVCIVVGTTLFLITSTVILYSSPAHWRLLEWATLVLLLGTSFTVLIDDYKEQKWAKWTKALFLPVIITVAGLLTTRGWDEIGAYRQDQALHRAVATEWGLNNQAIQLMNAVRENVRETDYSQPGYFQGFYTADIRRALGDASFVERFPELVDPLMEFALNAEPTNAKLRVLDSLLASGLRLPNRRKDMFEGIFEENGPYIKLCRAHDAIGPLLGSSFEEVKHKLNIFSYGPVHPQDAEKAGAPGAESMPSKY